MFFHPFSLRRSAEMPLRCAVVIPRGAAKLLPEELGEILAGIEAACEGNVGDAARRVFTQPAGSDLQAALVQMLQGRRVGDLFGVMDEMRHSQPALSGDGFAGPRCGQVVGILPEVRPEQFHGAPGADEGFVAFDLLPAKHVEQQHEEFIEKRGEHGK